jgi:hypothetical protein
MSRPAQRVRHCVFAPLEVREKRDKRDKRGKSPLPLPLEVRDKREKRDKSTPPHLSALMALMAHESLVANQRSSGRRHFTRSRSRGFRCGLQALKPRIARVQFAFALSLELSP